VKRRSAGGHRAGTLGVHDAGSGSRRRVSTGEKRISNAACGSPAMRIRC